METNGHASNQLSGGWTLSQPSWFWKSTLAWMLTLVSCCSLARAQSKSDWPEFLGPNRDGKSAVTDIQRDWTAGKLKVLWQIETGAGYGMGSLAAGKFYHFGKYEDEAELRCLDSNSGRLLWKFAYPSDYNDLYGYDHGPRASPVIDNGKVYLFGVEGMLHCLDAETGKLIWKVDTAQRFNVVQNFFGVGSTPVINGDLLLVMVGGSPEADQQVAPGALDQVRPNGSGIVAFDKRTGEIKYRAVNDLASYSSLKVAPIAGKSTLLAWMRNAFHGIDPQTGAERFRYPYRARMLESVNAATPVVNGNQLLLSECYQLGSVLLDLSSGQPRVIWSDQGRRGVMETHWNTAIQVDDLLIGSSGRHAGSAELRCVEWKTGKLQWRKRGLGRASCTYVDGHLVVLGEFGDLQLIKATGDDYQLVTRYEPGESGVKFNAPCWAAPVVADGKMWVRGRDKLVCFDISP